MTVSTLASVVLGKHDVIAQVGYYNLLVRGPSILFSFCNIVLRTTPTIFTTLLTSSLQELDNAKIVEETQRGLCRQKKFFDCLRVYHAYSLRHVGLVRTLRLGG